MASCVATLRQLVEAVAVRVPVAPAFGRYCHAVSSAILYWPLVATSHSSVMPLGGSRLATTLQAPPKSSRVPGTVVVTEGAVTSVDPVEPLLWAPAALTGVCRLACLIAAIPPAMS